MKRLLKNKIQILCLIIGLVISSIVFHYSIGIRISEEFEQEDIAENSYEYGASLSVFPALNIENNKEKIISDIVEFKNSVECIGDSYIYFPDIIAYIDDNYAQSLTDIYVCGNMPKYRLVSGGYPTEEMLESKNRYVVLGIYKKSLTHSRGGKDYITIEGEEYEVCGYVSAKNSRVLDNKVILFADNIGQNMLDCMYYQYISGSVFLSYNSDTYGNIYNEVEKQIKKTAQSYEEKYAMNEFFCERMNMRLSHGACTGSFSTAVVSYEYNLLAKLIYVFCIFVVIFVFEFWILVRKNEFAIRKINGYTNMKIFMLIVKEVFLCLITALALSEIIMCLIDYFGNGISVFYSKQMYLRFVSASLYVGLSMVFTCIYPFFELCIKKPIDILKCKDDIC